jgi:hypothetical protein
VPSKGARHIAGCQSLSFESRRQAHGIGHTPHRTHWTTCPIRLITKGLIYQCHTISYPHYTTKDTAIPLHPLPFLRHPIQHPPASSSRNTLTILHPVRMATSTANRLRTAHRHRPNLVSQSMQHQSRPTPPQASQGH